MSEYRENRQKAAGVFQWRMTDLQRVACFDLIYAQHTFRKRHVIFTVIRVIYNQSLEYSECAGSQGLSINSSLWHIAALQYSQEMEGDQKTFWVVVDWTRDGTKLYCINFTAHDTYLALGLIGSSSHMDQPVGFLMHFCYQVFSDMGAFIISVGQLQQIIEAVQLSRPPRTSKTITEETY